MYSVGIQAEDAAHAIGRSTESLADHVMTALARTAELASSYAKSGIGMRNVLYVSHTYGLRSSITWGTQAGSKSFHAVMRASAPYAAFVENGTKAHTIEPKRRQALRFVQNGAVRFSRIVNHPGTAPRPFMAQAQERATPLLERLMGEAFARAFT